MYRVQEFAERAGVTVRTLHHYDRAGLLRPSRTSAGYRVYNDRDLERLEQIVALKFIGLPLARIKVLLDRDAPSLAGALRAQRHVLGEKRRLLDCAIESIRQAEASLKRGERPPAEVLKSIIEVMEMQTNTDWVSKYYDEETRSELASRWSPELQAQAEKDWLQLYADAESCLAAGEDPAGPRAQDLAARYRKLIGAFTGGNPKAEQGLKSLYADRENWPSDFKQTMTPFGNPEAQQFLHNAFATARGEGV